MPKPFQPYTMKAAFDKIIVKRKVEKESDLITIVRPQGDPPPLEGYVVAIGESVTRKKDVTNGSTWWIEPGDLLVFGQYAAHKLNDTTASGDELWVIMEADIIYKKEMHNE